MATNQSQAPKLPTNDEAAAETNRLDGPSTQMLNDATHGQILDPERDGQQHEDQQDDSYRTDREAQAAAGPAAASAENLPRELTNPSDVAYTLPEEHS